MATLDLRHLFTFHISNFKSIKDLSIDVGRVNIFIGKPNSGKSNILEALSLLGMSLREDQTISHDEIRYTDIGSLYYHHNVDDNIVIALSGDNGCYCEIERYRENFKYFFEGEIIQNSKISEGRLQVALLSDGTALAKIDKASVIQKYHFKGIQPTQTDSQRSLTFSGNNLAEVVRENSRLKEFAASFFREFSLDVLFNKKSGKMDIMRKEGDSYHLIDFSMTPDTFQRMLYYLAAIETNRGATLLFEEPEAHSYPPYIQMLTDRILEEQTNQYFITTHSPFVIEKVMAKASNDPAVKIFITYYEDYQTKVRELTHKEIIYIMDNNIDLFFNMEAFQKA